MARCTSPGERFSVRGDVFDFPCLVLPISAADWRCRRVHTLTTSLV